MRRRKKEEAIDAGDFQAAARAKDGEREAMRRANETHGLDIAEVRRRAHRAIETARESLRS